MDEQPPVILIIVPHPVEEFQVLLPLFLPYRSIAGDSGDASMYQPVRVRNTTGQPFFAPYIVIAFYKYAAVVLIQLHQPLYNLRRLRPAVHVITQENKFIILLWGDKFYQLLQCL